MDRSDWFAVFVLIVAVSTLFYVVFLLPDEYDRVLENDDGWDANAQCVLESVKAQYMFLAVHKACVRYCEMTLNGSHVNPCYTECTPDPEPIDPAMEAGILGKLPKKVNK
jgi:hypothetical protein